MITVLIKCLTACRIAFPCLLDNIAKAVNACSATSIHCITCNYTVKNIISLNNKSSALLHKFNCLDPHNVFNWCHQLIIMIITQHAQFMKTNTQYNWYQSIWSILINRLISEIDDNWSPIKLWVSIFIDCYRFTSISLTFSWGIEAIDNNRFIIDYINYIDCLPMIDFHWLGTPGNKHHVH